MPIELTVFFTSMIPFLEMKLAIPVGIGFGLSKSTTLLFAVSGSIIPAAISLAIIGSLSNFLRRHSNKMDSFFEKLFSKTRNIHSKKFNRYGAIFLILFVAVPVPGSGTVGASLAAFLFGVDYWKALSLISLGAICSALLITAGFASINAILNIFI